MPFKNRFYVYSFENAESMSFINNIVVKYNTMFVNSSLFSYFQQCLSCILKPMAMVIIDKLCTHVLFTSNMHGWT